MPSATVWLCVKGEGAVGEFVKGSSFLLLCDVYMCSPSEMALDWMKVMPVLKVRT